MFGGAEELEVNMGRWGLDSDSYILPSMVGVDLGPAGIASLGLA